VLCYAIGTHQVVPVKSAAHHPSIEHALEIIKVACMQCTLQCYREQLTTKKKKKKILRKKSVTPHLGYLKYLLFNVDEVTEKVQLTIVWNSPNPCLLVTTSACNNVDVNKSEQILAEFLKSLGSNSTQADMIIDSIWVHYHPTVATSNASITHTYNENSITSRDSAAWRHICGPLAVYEDLIHHQAQLVFPPYVFRQANSVAFRKILQAIRNWVSDYSMDHRCQPLRPRCLELYGGI
jgi:hypothetical protein